MYDKNLNRKREFEKNAKPQRIVTCLEGNKKDSRSGIKHGKTTQKWSDYNDEKKNQK